MEQCDYLVPMGTLGPGIPLEDGDSGGCLLRKGHPGEHLVETPEGYYCWHPEEDFCRDEDGKICDCDFIECYVYWQVPDEQAKQILAENGAGAD